MKRLLLSVCALLAFAVPLATNVQAATPKQRPVIGWVEYVGIGDTDLVMKGRIDSGAGLASVNAQVMEVRKSGNGEKVVFSVMDDHGKKTTLERDVVEWVNIKKKGSSGYIRRPVVKMLFCVGGKRINARANLADRGGFLYPVLIGRNVLQTGNFMIDPTQKFIHPAVPCTPAK